MRRSLPLLVGSVVLLAACKPQNAELTRGSYTAFLSYNTSSVFVENEIRTDELQDTWVLDCRALFDEENRADGAEMSLCDPEDFGVSVPSSGGTRGLEHEVWMDRDAFLGVREDLEPWRGEGVMTSEGDFQVTFHHRLPGGDMRFAFVIDPKFQPSNCEQLEDGSVGLVPWDGDWVANWSRALTEGNYENGEVHWPEERSDEGTLYMLNAGSYQFNPDATEVTWALSPKMEAGYARARFGPEEMFNQASRYGQPIAYTNYDLDSRSGPDESLIYYVGLDPDEFGGDDFETEIRANNRFKNMMRRAEGDAIESNEDILAGYGPGVPQDDWTPAVPSNAWRKPDGFASGFDGWGELHYSWVRIDQNREDIEVGADVSGSFQLWFFGGNSQSRLLVQGDFEVNGVKKDRWVTKDVMADKLEENGTDLCGNAPEE